MKNNNWNINRITYFLKMSYLHLILFHRSKQSVTASFNSILIPYFVTSQALRERNESETSNKL